MKNAIRLSVVMLGVLATQFATATEYYWIPGSTDWTSENSYTNAAGQAAKPSANDEVAIPANCSAVLTDADMASFNFANTLGRIRPLAADSRLVFELSENADLTFNPAVNYLASYETEAYGKGGIVKRGNGTLTLGQGDDNAAYVTSITVEEGVFKLPQNAISYKCYYYDTLAVSNGATLCLCANPASNANPVTFPRQLMGDGVITNTSETTVFLEIYGSARSVFSGKIAGSANGKIRIDCNQGQLELTGTENAFYGMACAVQNKGRMEEGPYLGLAKLGQKGETSSVGYCDVFYFMDMRNKSIEPCGMFRYLGEGETTDKDFYFGYGSGGYCLDHPYVFDAGVNGGVVFNGNFVLYDASKVPDGNIRFAISGENTNNPCIVNSAFQNWGSGSHSFDIVKRGSGSWRFAAGAASDLLGSFTVEGGSLQYETLAQAGTATSLGKATLMPDGYAYSLGATEAGKDAVFEFVGTDTTWCQTRPFVLTGDAHVRNSSAADLRLADVRSLTAGEKTLVLDGEGAGESWMSDIADGAGVVSVEKSGSGTWVLAGSNTFSGTLSVKGGTLKIQTPETPYTWYRIWHKQIFELNAGKECMYCLEFGLYDKDGARQTKNMTRAAEKVLPDTIKNLGAGSFNWATELTVDEKNLGGEKRSTDLMFDGASDPASGAIFKDAKGAALVSTIADPTSWRPLVFRLPANANPVTSFDVLEYGDGAPTRRQYGVRAFALEGSADGVHWDLLCDHDSGEGGYRPDWQNWRFGATSYPNGNAPAADIETHVDGKVIASCAAELEGGTPRPVLNNVTAVSIAGGGRLEAIGGGRPSLPGSLAVDVVTGGTISGFAVPETGTLDIGGAERFVGALPLQFEDVTGVDNLAGWTLTDHGNVTRKTIAVKDGVVSIVAPGMMITIR